MQHECHFNSETCI